MTLISLNSDSGSPVVAWRGLLSGFDDFSLAMSPSTVFSGSFSFSFAMAGGWWGGEASVSEFRVDWLDVASSPCCGGNRSKRNRSRS